MTCAEIRDLFSARADEALTDDERVRVDAHLATCGECAREWRRFEATVGLLRAVEPPRAPAGFVDRVLAARPRPWYHRLGRTLLVPWPVKLPLEVAAIVLVAGLAVVIFQRSPDLQGLASAPDAGQVSFYDRLAPTGPPAGAREDVPRRPLLERYHLAPGASTVPRDATAPPAPPPPASPPPSTAMTRPRAAEPPRHDSTEAEVKETAPRAESRRQRAAAAVQSAAPGTIRATGKTEEPVPDLAAPHVQAHLTPADRTAAEREIRAIVAKLGGVVTAPRPGALAIAVPRAAWSDLARELARLGTLRIDREIAELPPTVRLALDLE